MNASDSIYPDGLDDLLVEQAMKPGKPGRLKYFYEIAEHPGWYAFIFERRSMSCTIDCGIQLGLFVECGPNTVELNQKLAEQLNEPEES